MPRGRCHFSLLLSLQECLKDQLPEIAVITHAHFPDFLAGALAPDAMRSMGKMGKYRSHFYAEDQPDTWGKSVSGMFATHPNLANPASLRHEDIALLLGYIAHLTTDEAFRDEVTIHVHGVENWRPIIRGLWSFVDELPVCRDDLGAQIDRFVRDDVLGFISCDIAGQFLRMARGWAEETDAWQNELVFLKMIGKTISPDEAHETFCSNRLLADPFWDEGRKRAFLQNALKRGMHEIEKFMGGDYAMEMGVK